MDTVKCRSRSAGMGRRFARYCCGCALGVLLTGSVEPGVFAAKSSLDSEGGFADAKLGAPFSSFSGLVKVRTSQGIDYFRRQGGDLSFAGVKLESGLYGFSGGALARIQLRTPTEKESSPCGDNARSKALRMFVEAYSDVLLADQSDPVPSDPLVKECLGETGPGDCAVFEYQAKKIQIRLRAIEGIGGQEETSRRSLTAEQLQAYLREARAKLMPEESPLEEALVIVRKERLAKFHYSTDGAQIYDGADGSIIGVKEVQGGRFDVMTLKDVGLCYHTVEFGALPPPAPQDDWVRKLLEKEKQEK